MAVLASSWLYWSSGSSSFSLCICSNVSSPVLQTALLAGLVLQVPFFADHTDQCGPSVVASVLSFWGTPMTPSELKQEIYVTHLKGSLAIDLMLAAQNHGFKAHLYRETWRI